LRAVLEHGTVLGFRGDRGVDVVVSRTLRELGRQLYFHVPSLADHIGKGISSLGHAPLDGSVSVGFSASYNRYARREPGHAGTIQAEVRDSGVTVVVATYNCAGYLANCLASLQRQSVGCEIVVVDDGSRDETAEVLRPFEGTVRVVRH